MAGPPPIREKQHRLPRASYLGRVNVAFTACIADKLSAFTDPLIVTTFRSFLENAANKFNCLIPVYCFMSDHLHVVMTGRDESADTYAAMVAFKQQSGFWFARNRPSYRWQKDFYDHIIRVKEDFVAQVKYFAENPVRRGLVREWYEYPYTGAIGIDLRQLLIENALDEVGGGTINR